MLSSSPFLMSAFVQPDVSNNELTPGVARRVRLRLRRSGYAEMRRVEVSIEGDTLTLSGVVYSYHMKQLAQEIARQTVPNVIVHNHLMVVSAPRPTAK